MVEKLLTPDMINAGAALIQNLDQRGIQPDAAFWLYSSEQMIWKLIITEIKIGKEGPKKYYQRIQKILAESPNIESNISLEDVALVRPDETIVSLLRIAIRTGPGIDGIRFKSNVINGIFIDDAYIYRMT